MDIEKIKSHFKKNKWTYICTGTTVVLAGITIIIMRKNWRTKLVAGMDWPEKAPTDSFFDNKNHVPNLQSGLECLERGSTGSFIFGNDNHHNTVTTIHTGIRGNPGFITRCVETGELFENQGVASRAFDIPESVMSKHLNYGRELQEGLHFERVGVFQ